MKDFSKQIISDLRVELKDEFDKNFQRKAFFDRPWKQTKMLNKKGSLMMRTGALRQSLQAISNANQISFTSSLPYANIHNEGGTIKVTAQMKKFFWAMYYKANGSISTTKGKKLELITEEARWWKNLALKKVGSQIKIEKRQFIGWHPQLEVHIERVINENLKDIEKYMNQKFKKR